MTDRASFKLLSGFVGFPRRRGRGERWDLTGLHEPTLAFLRQFQSAMTDRSQRLLTFRRSTLNALFAFLSEREHQGDIALVTDRDWDDYQRAVRTGGVTSASLYRQRRAPYDLFERAMECGLRPRAMGNPVPKPKFVAPLELELLPPHMRALYDGFVAMNQQRAARRVETQGRFGLAPSVAQQKNRVIGHFLVDTVKEAADEGRDPASIDLGELLSDHVRTGDWIRSSPAWGATKRRDGVSASTRRLRFSVVCSFLRWAHTRRRIGPPDAVDDLRAYLKGDEHGVYLGGFPDELKEALGTEDVHRLFASIRYRVDQAKAWRAREPQSAAAQREFFHALRDDALCLTAITGCCRVETLHTFSLDRFEQHGSAFVVFEVARKARNTDRWGRADGANAPRPQFVATVAHDAIAQMLAVIGVSFEEMGAPTRYEPGDVLGDSPIADQRVMYHAWKESNGSPMSVDAIASAIDRALSRAGIAATAHRLRATGASLYLNELGLTISDVAQIGGWSRKDYRALLRHYAQRNAREIYATADAQIDGLLGKTTTADEALIQGAATKLAELLEPYAAGRLRAQAYPSLLRALIAMVDLIGSRDSKYVPTKEWVVWPRDRMTELSRKLHRRFGVTLADLTGAPIRTGLPVNGLRPRPIPELSVVQERPA